MTDKQRKIRKIEPEIRCLSITEWSIRRTTDHAPCRRPQGKRETAPRTAFLGKQFCYIINATERCYSQILWYIHVNSHEYIIYIIVCIICMWTAFIEFCEKWEWFYNTTTVVLWKICLDRLHQWGEHILWNALP